MFVCWLGGARSRYASMHVIDASRVEEGCNVSCSHDDVACMVQFSGICLSLRPLRRASQPVVSLVHRPRPEMACVAVMAFMVDEPTAFDWAAAPVRMCSKTQSLEWGGREVPLG